MKSNYEQEELDKIQKEFEEAERLESEKQKLSRMQWRPWKWSWKTLLLWTVIALLVRFIIVWCSSP